MLATQRFKPGVDPYHEGCVEILCQIIKVWENCTNEDWKKYYPIHEGNHPHHKKLVRDLIQLQTYYGPIHYCNIKHKAKLPEKIISKDYQLFYSENWGYTVEYKGHQEFSLGHCG